MSNRKLRDSRAIPVHGILSLPSSTNPVLANASTLFAVF